MEPLSCPQQRGQDRLGQGAIPRWGRVEEVMWVGETSVCVLKFLLLTLSPEHVFGTLMTGWI